MIALPVLAVTAAAVVQATADVNGIEGADRRMGAAEARIRPVGGAVFQSPDPEDYGAGGWGTEGEGGADQPSYDAVTAVLGPTSGPSRCARAGPRSRWGTGG